MPDTTKATEARKTNGNSKSKNAPGVIPPGTTMRLNAFIKLWGTTRSGVTEMQKRGFKVRKDGGRSVVRAADLDEYAAQLPVAEVGAKDD